MSSYADINAFFASYVRAERARKSLGQSALAQACGLSRCTISNIECCKIKPSLMQVFKITKVLDISTDSLFEDFERKK